VTRVGLGTTNRKTESRARRHGCICKAAERAIGVASLQHLPMLRQAPTVAESRFPGYEAGNSYGLVARAGTPPDIIAVINRAALTALAKLNKRLLEIAYIPVANRLDEYAAYLKVEILKVASIYQRLGLTPY
jgi:tripartite-type tricarboxylate transporter receptor subunit TctC